MRIIGTPLTMGQVNGLPAGKYYTYQGDKPIPDDERGVPVPLSGGAKLRAADRMRREAEFGRLRDQGIPRDEAALRVGVAVKTARRYETAWNASRAACLARGHDWQPAGDDPEGADPMRCYRCGITETEAAGIEMVKRAGREAWNLHQQREGGASHG